MGYDSASDESDDWLSEIDAVSGVPTGKKLRISKKSKAEKQRWVAGARMRLSAYEKRMQKQRDANMDADSYDSAASEESDDWLSELNEALEPTGNHVRVPKKTKKKKTKKRWRRDRHLLARSDRD